jgi:hypothetical protein
MRLEIDLNQHNNGTDGSDLEALTIYNDTLFFIANDGFVGSELFKCKNGVAIPLPELVPGTDGIRDASLDSTAAGLIVGHGRTASLTRSYIYKHGSLRASPHRFVPVGDPGISNDNKLSSVVTVPALNVKLVAFVGATSSQPNTLVGIMQDGSYKYFSAPADFRMPTNLRGVLVAGSWIYLSAFQEFIWRISTNAVMTETRPDLQVRQNGLFYPNPNTSGHLFYKGAKPLKGIEIIDAQGRVCHRQEQLDPDGTIRLGTMSRGLYVIGATEGGTRIYTRLIVQ